MRDAGGSRNKTWRAVVAAMAAEAWVGRLPLRGALYVTMTFSMPRPRRHFRRKTGALRPDAPGDHTHAPDLTKLVRSTEDALTGIVWIDDAQVVGCDASKRWSYLVGTSGCEIKIYAGDPCDNPRGTATPFDQIQGEFKP